MPTYRFTMSCGHVREVESEQPPNSRTPHCYECREATGKKVQKPMTKMEVRDGKKWTAIDLPEPAPRGEGRTGKGKVAKRSKRAPVETLVAAMAEARELKAAKKAGKPLPDTPNLDAVNAAHGVTSIKGQVVTEPSDTEGEAQATEEAPKKEATTKVTRKPAAAQAAKKGSAKKPRPAAPAGTSAARKDAQKKATAAKRQVTPIPKKVTSRKAS